MTKDDIIRMAREAATEDGSVKRTDGKNVVIYAAKTNRFLERFAALVAAHEREKVAHWQIGSGYTTGHGNTIEDLLVELEWQVREIEREACAKECDIQSAWGNDDERFGARQCAAAIRSRGNL